MGNVYRIVGDEINVELSQRWWCKSVVKRKWTIQSTHFLPFKLLCAPWAWGAVPKFHFPFSAGPISELVLYGQPSSVKPGNGCTSPHKAPDPSSSTDLILTARYIILKAKCSSPPPSVPLRCFSTRPHIVPSSHQ